MTDTPTKSTSTKSWIFYAALLVLFWGVWGAFSALPTTKYGYPNEMVYSIWALTMIIPAVPPPWRFTTDAAWLRLDAGAPATAARTK